ncbi:unnamed protein product [Cyprideis torosa]|uniref:Uncharacterized protein n=1 Tax=Cyprideis torosa TaxID=163714 RepID=A0A7R8ZH15_9CRUS|nr:unnamed protein product [Cyprideis torosa]CAG0882644.1 unnamed protein product [Cyprideis torosa]
MNVRRVNGRLRPSRIPFRCHRHSLRELLISLVFLGGIFVIVKVVTFGNDGEILGKAVFSSAERDSGSLWKVNSKSEISDPYHFQPAQADSDAAFSGPMAPSPVSRSKLQPKDSAEEPVADEVDAAKSWELIQADLSRMNAGVGTAENVDWESSSRRPSEKSMLAPANAVSASSTSKPKIVPADDVKPPVQLVAKSVSTSTKPSFNVTRISLKDWIPVGSEMAREMSRILKLSGGDILGSNQSGGPKEKPMEEGPLLDLDGKPLPVVGFRGNRKIVMMGGTPMMESLAEKLIRAQRKEKAMNSRLHVGKAKQSSVYDRRHRPRVDRPPTAEEIAETVSLVRAALKVRIKKYRIKDPKVLDFQIGDLPSLKVFIVAPWRSGSTFLSQVLDQYPGVFYHYEPFAYLGIKRLKDFEEAKPHLSFLQGLQECKFNHSGFLNTSKKNADDMMGQKEQIWPYCRKGPNRYVCFTEQFLHDACQSFPIHLTKVVRLHLDLLKPSFDSLLVKNDEETILEDDVEDQGSDAEVRERRSIGLHPLHQTGKSNWDELQEMTSSGRREAQGTTVGELKLNPNTSKVAPGKTNLTTLKVYNPMNLQDQDLPTLPEDDSEVKELDLSGPNVRVIYLTRDPRGIMHSRMTTVKWCKKHSVCSSTYKVCQDLNEEIKTAKELQKKFPEIFKILKYEDMAGFPQETFKELFTWLGLEFNDKMKEVVNTFTTEEKKGKSSTSQTPKLWAVNSNKPWSVKKDSKTRIARWKGGMRPEDIKEIEDACVDYMLENSYAFSEMDNDLEH